MKVKLPTASYNLPGRNPSRLLNAYAQASVGKTPVEVLGCPGIVSFCTPTYGSETPVGRVLYEMKGQLYAVVGQSFFTVSSTGSYTRIGAVPGTGRLMLAGNGTQIVTDTGLIYDGTTITPITDADRPSWEAVDFIDGYVVYVESNSQRFGGSALYDSSSYDGLDYASAEGSPDNLLSLIVDHRQVILFGTDSTEIWWNSGIAGFPFERLSGGFLELGGLARFGATKADNSVFWLASDRTIRRLSGSTPLRVSTHGVEEKLSAYTTVSDCEAFSWTWEGHIFVAFRFSAQGACWVLDVTTNEWHERKTFGSSTWNISHAVSCGGKVYVMDATTGSIGTLDDTVYTEFGTTLRREVTFPDVYNNGSRLFHSQFDAIFRTGDSPTGVTPYVTLEISDDGGSTWRALPDRPLGEIGEYRKIVRWPRLGSARDRVYRIACASAAPFYLVDASLDVAAGRK